MGMGPGFGPGFDSVRLTVAPEGSGPVDGWPYDKVLGALVENPAIKPEALAVNLATSESMVSNPATNPTVRLPS